MQIDVGNTISILIGGLLVFAGQWFASYKNAKIEERKWRQEALREVRRDVVKFREQRVKPIIEALDRVADRWDVESILELADATGYAGEKIDSSTEEYKRQSHERKAKYFEQMKSDIAAASVIHDPDVRRTITRVLRESIDPEFVTEENSPTLQGAYLKLENWIFNPQINTTPHKQRD